MNRFVAKVNPEDGETYVVDRYGPKDDVKGIGYRLCLCVEEGVAIKIAEALTRTEAWAQLEKNREANKARHHVPFRRLTADEFLELPPVAVAGEVGKLVGLLWVGAGNVYASLAGAHGDNFLISTGIKADGSFSLDVEGTDWVECGEEVKELK